MIYLKAGKTRRKDDKGVCLCWTNVKISRYIWYACSPRWYTDIDINIAIEIPGAWALGIVKFFQPSDQRWSWLWKQARLLSCQAPSSYSENGSWTYHKRIKNQPCANISGHDITIRGCHGEVILFGDQLDLDQLPLDDYLISMILRSDVPLTWSQSRSLCCRLRFTWKRIYWDHMAACQYDHNNC